jgi:ATP-dependent DNA ligase
VRRHLLCSIPHPLSHRRLAEYTNAVLGRSPHHTAIPGGFTSTSAKDLQARLKPLIRKTQPYAKKIAHRGIWVEPPLSAEIEYRAKSADGKVRHPFFKGLREDL